MLAREAMDKHPGFKKTGQRLLKACFEGVNRLRSQHAYAMRD